MGQASSDSSRCKGLVGIALLAGIVDTTCGVQHTKGSGPAQVQHVCSSGCSTAWQLCQLKRRQPAAPATSRLHHDHMPALHLLDQGGCILADPVVLALQAAGQSIQHAAGPNGSGMLRGASGQGSQHSESLLADLGVLVACQLAQTLDGPCAHRCVACWGARVLPSAELAESKPAALQKPCMHKLCM